MARSGTRLPKAHSDARSCGLHSSVQIQNGVNARWKFAAPPAVPDTSHSTLRDDRFEPGGRSRAPHSAAHRHHEPRAQPAKWPPGRRSITSRERGGSARSSELASAKSGARLTLSCEPDGCEQVMRALGERSGPITPQGRNLTLIAGLSGPAWARVQLAGGVRLHNLAGEGMSTAEMYLTTAIRFGAF